MIITMVSVSGGGSYLLCSSGGRLRSRDGMRWDGMDWSQGEEKRNQAETCRVNSFTHSFIRTDSILHKYYYHQEQKQACSKVEL